MKKIITIILLFLILNFLPKPIIAQETELYLFYDEACPVCAQAQSFLGQLKRKYPGLEIKLFKVFQNAEIKKIYLALGKIYNLDLKSLPVPVIFIGNRGFNGYNSTIATQIEQTVIKCIAQQCPSPLEKLKKQISTQQESKNKNFFSYFIIIGGIIVLFFLIKKKKK